MQRRNHNVSIYNLSSGPTLPEWLGDRARRNLSKRDEAVRRRIELIQDFQMPSSSNKIVQSRDGRYIMVGGTYPPRIRCFDVHDVSLKFERYVNSEIVDVCMLGEDYGKMAILMEDRTIAFHAHYGAHESIRIPKFGRSMAYEPTTCELLIAASGSDLYRVNLEEGRFREPWTTESTAPNVAASCIAVAHTQPLAAVGFDDGLVRFWDNRSPDTLLKPFLKLDVQSATTGYGFADDGEGGNIYHKNLAEITSLAYDTSGLYMAAGTAGGLVALYDIRSSKPLHIQEHKHGMPIHTIHFHSGSGCVLSGDEKLIKIWKYKSTGDLVNSTAAGVSADRFGALSSSANEDSSSGGTGMGAIVANVEGTGKFSSFILAGDEQDPLGHSSGVLMCTTDQPKLESYYIPKVGLAPKWCSFLENITEELEERDLQRASDNDKALVQEGQETIFENYKFVSENDLEELGVSDLIGTPMLKAYMHGFFMDIQLYNRIKAVANPFAYEDYRKKKLKERLQAKQASRIAPKNNNATKTAAVNPDLAERLQTKADNSTTTKAGKVASQLLSDDRFGNLFSNPDFEIDEDDINFRLRNPSGVAVANKSKKHGGKRDDMDSDDDDGEDDQEVLDDEEDVSKIAEKDGFRRVQDLGDYDDDSDGLNDEISDDSDDDDEDGFRGGKVRGEAYDEVRKTLKTKKPTPPTRSSKRIQKKTALYEAQDLGHANAAALGVGAKSNEHQQRVQEKLRKMNLPLEQRFAKSDGGGDSKARIGGDPYVKVTHKGGAKEITYVPKDARPKTKAQKHDNDDGDDEARLTGGRPKRQRRGVKELGLKTPTFRQPSGRGGRKK